MRAWARLTLIFLLVGGASGCAPDARDWRIGTARAVAPRAPYAPITLALCEDYPEEARDLARVRADFEVLRDVGVATYGVRRFGPPILTLS